MPPPPRPDPPPHSIHVTAIGTCNGFPWATTHWVRNGNAQEPTQDDFTQWTNSFGSAYVTRFCPQMTPAVTVVEFSSLYYIVGGASLAGAVSYNSPGTDAGNPLPLNVAMCIGWRVAAHYRGGHPRTYLPGISTSRVTNARSFSPTYTSQVAGAAATFHTDVNSSSHGAIQGCKLGTVSFVSKKAWRPTPIFRDFILNSAHCDTRIDSMRRRLGRDIPP